MCCCDICSRPSPSEATEYGTHVLPSFRTPLYAHRHDMQVEVPWRPHHCQSSSATLQQLRATATSLQPKLQDAMQQAMRSGATCFSARQAVPDETPMPTLRRLQHHIMSSQTAPHDGICIYAVKCYLSRCLPCKASHRRCNATCPIARGTTVHCSKHDTQVLFGCRQRATQTLSP